MYDLPHLLVLLENPLSKEISKHLIKSKVLDYWQTKFRVSAQKLLFKLDFSLADIGLKPSQVISHLVTVYCAQSVQKTSLDPLNTF